MIALVIVAGAAGAVVRLLAVRLIHAPWGVLVVNIVGSAIAGLVVGAAVPEQLQIVVVTGLCGGLTTFSTFSVETIQLVQQGRTRAAVLSVVGNLVLGIGIACLGFWVGSALFGDVVL